MRHSVLSRSHIQCPIVPQQTGHEMNLQRFDLATLYLYTMTVRTGSISKGAELANLAVASASKRIADLEVATGVTLLERHSRGVTPTAAGRALLERAYKVLQEIEHLGTEMSDFASGVIGVVKPWANTSAIMQFLPHELAHFQMSNPGVLIELEEQNSVDVVMAVRDGRADFGIFADRTLALGLQTMKFHKDRLVLVVPQKHLLSRRRAVRFSEALDFDFVSLSKETSLAQRLQEETALLGGRLRLRIQVRSFDAMCLMVAAGMGVAVLPQAAIQPHLKSMGLRQIALDEPWAQRQLLIGVRDVDILARPVRMLIDHLCEQSDIRPNPSLPGTSVLPLTISASQPRQAENDSLAGAAAAECCLLQAGRDIELNTRHGHQKKAGGHV
jgi:DNA-binding transcriptional LysR family regulator